MKTRAIAITVLSLLAAASLSLASCQQRSSTVPLPGAKDGLFAAASDLATTNYAVSLASGDKTSVGTVDPSAKAATNWADYRLPAEPCSSATS